MPSSRAEYYRLQARLCVRLSVASSDSSDISEHLIALAQRFKARAEAIESEHQPSQTNQDASGVGYLVRTQVRPRATAS
jgi:hypothetical protein